MKNLINKIKREITSLLVGSSVIKTDRQDFSKIYNDAKEIYLAGFTNFAYDKYVIGEWLKNIKMMEDCFLNKFDFNFLRLPVIRNTMFATSTDSWVKNQMNYLESKVKNNELKDLLIENNLGGPILTNFRYKTSTNSIHLLYHFIKFSSELNVNLNNLSTIIEFGGGYGDAAKIFKRINKQSTYIIIDLPIFSFLQLVYLKSIFGENKVILVDKISNIQKGKINIIPFNTDKIKELKEYSKDVDLFLSTWALSETPDVMQNFIKSLNYFDAKYILIGYQKSNDSFSYSENLKNMPVSYKILFNKETDYVKGNYYLFCQKIK
jgi:putative sugar O-methyltransferase